MRPSFIFVACLLMAPSLTACGPDPIVGKWNTQRGEGTEFSANGTCGPITKHGEPWLCWWKRRDDGKYDIQIQSDVSTLKTIGRIDAGRLVYTFTDGSKPLVLSRQSNNQ